jgi:hypothetical protein
MLDVCDVKAILNCGINLSFQNADFATAGILV